MVVWENGRLDWGGTKRERPSTTSFEVTPSQQEKAYNFIGQKVKFKFDDNDYAVISFK